MTTAAGRQLPNNQTRSAARPVRYGDVELSVQASRAVVPLALTRGLL